MSQIDEFYRAWREIGLSAMVGWLQLNLPGNLDPDKEKTDV